MKNILYSVLYIFSKFTLAIILLILPADMLNRLAVFLPSRLILFGLSFLGAEIGNDTLIMPPITFHNFGDKHGKPFSNLSIGDHCFIGRGAFLDLKSRIIIEDNATCAMQVSIITHTDVYKSPLKKKYTSTSKEVRICKGGYIGAGVTILQGVEVGSESVIAAGAIVTRSVPSNVFLVVCRLAS